MSIETRSRQFGKVFDHWQMREFLGEGSGGKTAVFRLVRVDSQKGTSALKIVNLIEERGSFDALSEYRRQEYRAVLEEITESAAKEVWVMNDMQGNSNIVDYLDHTFVDWADENGFGRDMLIRMELLDDLRREMRRGTIFSQNEILKIGCDLCNALVLCHGKNIIHRDIKPENIFVNRSGSYKLGDFGVARILDSTASAMASTNVGTAEYAAPEQFHGKHDKRVDIYSLGLVLYELANGNRLPFAETSYVRQQDVFRRLHGEEFPAPVNAEPSLAQVIAKACAFRPEDRYATAEEFLDALEHVSVDTGDLIPEPPAVPEIPVSKRESAAFVSRVLEMPEAPKKKKKWWIPAAAAALAAVVGIGALVNRPAKEPAADVGVPEETAAIFSENPGSQADASTEPEHVIATATIGATGDILMHMPVVNTGLQDDGTYNFDSIFQFLNTYSSSVDYAVANLETTLCGTNNGYQYSGNPQFNCPDEIIDGARDAGFDMMLTANNHCYDTRQVGLLRTINVIQNKGLEVLGTYEDTEAPKYSIIDVNGIKIGMLCYTYENFNLQNDYAGDEQRIASFLPDNPAPFYNELEGYMEKMKAQGAEATVMFIHWGEEYALNPIPYQKTMAQKLCDIGFDVIVGGHPHVVEPVELLTSTEDPDHKTVCLYSMGNAVSNERNGNVSRISTAHTEDGVWFTFTFSKYSDGTVYLESVDLIPTWVNLVTDEHREYRILPLDYSLVDDWQELFHLSDTSFDAALNSYNRTMALVGEGINASNAYLHEAKAQREADYPGAIEEGTQAAASTEQVPVHMMATMEGSDSYQLADDPFWNQTQYVRRDIVDITFHSSLKDAKEDAWDISAEKDRSVLAWVAPGGSLHVAADGKVALPADSRYLFADFYNVKSINWNNAVDTSHVTNMRDMFRFCRELGSLDLSTFDTSYVVDMTNVFAACVNLRNLNLSGWNTSRVTNMFGMFEGIDAESLDLSSFDTSNVTDMACMFASTLNLRSLDLSSFNTKQVTTVYEMFESSGLQELDISHFDMQNVAYASEMFQDCISLHSLKLPTMDREKIKTRDIFLNCEQLTNLTVGGTKVSTDIFSTKTVSAKTDSAKTDSAKTGSADANILANLPSGELYYNDRVKGGFWGQETWKRCDVKTVTFRNTLAGAPWDSADVSEAQDGSVLAWMTDGNLIVAANGRIKPQYSVGEMFEAFENVTSIQFNGVLDISDCVSTDFMFANCNNLKSVDLSSLDTSNVLYMNHMFMNCESLESIDLSNMDTSNVIDMESMFRHCTSLKLLDLRNLNLSAVQNMTEMLYSCEKLETVYFPECSYRKDLVLDGIFQWSENVKTVQCSNPAINNAWKYRYPSRNEKP